MGGKTLYMLVSIVGGLLQTQLEQKSTGSLATALDSTNLLNRLAGQQNGNRLYSWESNLSLGLRRRSLIGQLQWWFI
jgi:hypothetical protein